MILILLKSFTLTNTESQYLEWKLNEYIEILLESPAAKPFFAKNNDGIYTLFPKYGVSISKDTKDEWEINLLKFLSSNVPNKLSNGIVELNVLISSAKIRRV